ncbi:MAG: MltA domain-containing protein [Phycisphaerales bacterium]|nr:MAG: MltA domain-containing protein [Phycisphaerales bacterium]
MSRKLLVLVSGIAFILPGCRKPEPPPVEPDYARPLPEGLLALRKLAPAAYPDFSRGFYSRARLAEAIHHSLDYLAKPSSLKYFPYGDVTHARAVASLERFLDVLNEAKTPPDLDRIIRRDFEVYQSVGYDGHGTVFFTGYYTPIFDGRKHRTDRFRYPLYRCPPDLAKGVEGTILGRKLPGGTYTPYETRREIEQGKLLSGLEIAWLADPFEAYVVTVQGSARIRLEDGSLWELGYAGNNGHEYTAVGYLLVDDGHISRNDLSLQAMIRFFDDHPEQFEQYCWQNDRYVFFQETQGGPYGSIGAPVTEMRTIATDKEVFPRACLAFLQTELPMLFRDEVRIRPHDGFALDQDTGGAIRAAGRCDLYMGVGDAAAALAGRARAEGRLYYIFVKPALMR